MNRAADDAFAAPSTRVRVVPPRVPATSQPIDDMTPHRFSLRAAGALLLTATLAAQSDDGAYWNEHVLPANVTNVRGLGSQVLVETPTEFHFYSGLHRQWCVQPVTAPTNIGFANRHCVWQDGTTVYGYSATTNRVAALATSGSATATIGSATSSWTAYVQDGTTVWAWSAFFGEWKPLQAATLPQVGIGSHMVACDDGVQLSAFSAFFGEWVSIPNPGITSLQTWRNGTIATTSTPDRVVAFSAYTNSWNTVPFPTSSAVPNVQVFDAFAAVADGNNGMLWYSALHGEFLPSFWPSGTQFLFGKSAGIVTAPNGAVFGYSPSQSTLVPIATVAPPTITVAQGSFGGLAVLDDGASLQAFSGFTGTVTATPGYVPGATVTVGDTEAFAEDPSGLANFAYSAIRGDWSVAAPLSSSSTWANFECIVRELPGGFEAYSARTGTFATLPAAGTFIGLTNGSIAGIQNAAGIDVFDPRYGRWDHVATGPTASFGVHRLVGISQDGAAAHAFGLWHHAWESTPLQGTVTDVRVNSSIGFVRTSTHIYVYTANGSMSTFARFPEFSRFHVMGQPLSHVNTGNPGAFVFAALSLHEVEAPTPWGTLRLDPTDALVIPAGIVPADGLLYTPIATPTDPALRGDQFFMQDVIFRPSGELALSNGHAHYLW